MKFNGKVVRLSCRYAPARDAFSETDHPRDKGGKFAHAGSHKALTEAGYKYTHNEGNERYFSSIYSDPKSKKQVAVHNEPSPVRWGSNVVLKKAGPKDFSPLYLAGNSGQLTKALTGKLKSGVKAETGWNRQAPK